MKKIFFLAFVNLFFILMSGLGEAFVLQTPHLLNLVVQKIRQPVGIEVYQTKKILNCENTEKEPVKLGEKLIYLYPNRFRSEIISDILTSFSVESGFRFVKVANGMTVSHDKPWADLYSDILLYRDPESLINQLALNGIDTAKVSFQRFKDTICYVIGRSPEKSKGKPFAGLWIEKDTFLPIKYVVEKNGWLVEFVYTDWRQVDKTWYPMQIGVFLDNQLFAMIDVNKIDLKSGVSPALFDIDHIERLYPKNEPNPLDENSKQVDELGRHIENFKKLYE